MTPVAAGLAAGYSIAIKPSNSIFLVGAPAALPRRETQAHCCRSRRTRAGAAHARALEVPRTGRARCGAGPGTGSARERRRRPARPHPQPARSTAGRTFEIAAAVVARALLGRARDRVAASRGSDRAPRALAPRVLAVGAWFAVFVATKGSYVRRSIDDASFFRILMPSFPAYRPADGVGLLLVPGVASAPGAGVLHCAAGGSGADRPRRGGRGVRRPAARRHRCDASAGATEAARRSSPGRLRAGVVRRRPRRRSANGNAVQLTWDARTTSGHQTFYGSALTGPGDGLTCAHFAGTPASTAGSTRADLVAATRSTSSTTSPASGTWTYRIAVSANWLNDAARRRLRPEPAGHVTVP